MTSLKRDDLKKPFRNGSLPTQDDFARLIDSFVHVDEFKEWTQKGWIELGTATSGRWRLSTAADGSLLVAPVPDPASSTAVAPTPATQTNGIHFGDWVGITSRRGLHRDKNVVNETQKPPAHGSEVPLCCVPANGKWQAILESGLGADAFEIVASGQSRTSPPARSSFWTWLGFATPTSTMLHGIALSAGDGSLPSASATVAPARPRRLHLVATSAISLLGGILSLMFALFMIPASACPRPWGASCLAVVWSDEAGLLVLSAILLALCAVLVTGLAMTRQRALELRWIPVVDDRSYRLCVRSPAIANGMIFYHVTRLW